MHTAGTADLGSDDTEPDPQMFGRQAGLLMGFPKRGFLGRLMAVPGSTGQAPGVALMAPRRPVLQQHPWSAIDGRGAQQQSGGPVPTPMLSTLI